MANPTLRPRGDLASEITPIVMGGAAWSHQLNHDAETRPVIPVILNAFDHGIRTIDTSPYYEPSEKILGKALADPQISALYKREDYFLMTKVGRIASEEFDYSPSWIRESVQRSLRRFQTGYLDVVFCHDVEFISDAGVVEAVRTLWEFVEQGKIRYNTKLRTEGLRQLGEAGVQMVCSSSPLNIGLLRAQGDWHPAPSDLRLAVSKAADLVSEKGDDLASLALRFAVRETARREKGLPAMALIMGPGSVAEVESCAAAAKSVRDQNTQGKFGDLRDDTVLDKEGVQSDEPLVQGVREILGRWIDFSFESPPKGWDVEAGKMGKVE
ncbi:Aldo/keto reductase [Aureobasidium pullulans]|uniref:Aldo/keto reductase n=1 Tax=Aureobasidium pullulans TaxID=5580 RepID=A0A4S8XTG4_AURPU|nr:Aldo/keto reductase [Aureobasidium pullulans]THX51091.1 Aldo/keto reductase [Aureobasidium pullulans]